MIGIDNSGILKVGQNCDCQGFIPAANFVYDGAGLTVKISDASTLTAGDSLKSLRARIYDRFGNEAAGHCSGGYAAVVAALAAKTPADAATAAALVTKTTKDTATATALTAKTAADALLVANPASVPDAEAATAADDAYTAALAASTAADNAYTAALAVSTAADAAYTTALNAANTGNIDIHTLNPEKGLIMKVSILTDAGCYSEGEYSNVILAAAGAIAHWQTGVDACEQVNPGN